MAKKVILRDLNDNKILPITRGELVLDSSGMQAFHSNEFLATDSLPGLMSIEDKIKIKNLSGEVDFNNEFVTLSTNQTITGVKTFTNLIKFSSEGYLHIAGNGSYLRFSYNDLTARSLLLGKTDFATRYDNVLSLGNTNSRWSNIYTYNINVANSVLVNGKSLGNLAFKDSLSFSEITSKPTTLAGYGITDWQVLAKDGESIDSYKTTAGIYRWGSKTTSNTPDYGGYGNSITLHYPTRDTWGQLYIPYDNSYYAKDGIWWRGGTTSFTGAWRKILDDSNFSNYALPLSGGTITGYTIIKTTGTLFCLMNSGGNIPYLNFRSDINGVNTDLGDLGVDPADKNLKYYNSGAWRTIIHSGNIGSQNVNYATSAGNADTLDGYHAKGNGLYNLFKWGAPVTNGTSTKWSKIASWSCYNLDNNTDVGILLHTSYSGVFAQIHCIVRYGEAVRLIVNWSNGLVLDNLRLYYNDAKSSFELWYYTGADWSTVVAELLYETSRNGQRGNFVTMYYETQGTPSLPHYVTPQRYHIQNTCEAASKLIYPRTIWGRSFDGSGNVSGELTLQNNTPISTTDSEGNVMQVLRTTATNIFSIGYGSAIKDYGTIIYGKTIRLRYGNDTNDGLFLNSSGNVTIGNSNLATTNYKLFVDGKSYTNGQAIINGDVSITANQIKQAVSGCVGIAMFAGLSSTAARIDVIGTDGQWAANAIGLGATGNVTMHHNLTVSGDITSSGFKTPTGTNDYVLLAGGSAAKISDLSINYAGRATSVGDSTMIMYPQNNNEVNFGGSNTNGNIYFGYKATDSRPIPSNFIFGGGGGAATLTATKLHSTGILLLVGTSGIYLKCNNADATSLVLNATLFKPFDSANNKLTLGSDSARWSNVYSYLGNFAGTVSINCAWPNIVCNNNASGATESNIRFEIAGVSKGYIGYKKDYGTFLWNSTASKYVYIADNGYFYTQSYINVGAGNEKNASNPPYVWGVNGSDNFMRTYATSSLSVNYANSAGYASSAGNANKLDNIDSTEFLRKVTVANNTTNDFNTFENMTLTGRGDPTTGASLSNAPWSGSGPAGGYGVLTYLWSGYGIQMAWGYHNNRVYIRNKYYNSGSVWSSTWDSLALTSDLSSYATISSLNNLGDALDVVKATYLPLSGGTMTGCITTKTGNSTGIKVGDTYITSVSGELLLQNNSSIRFGGSGWDWNVWAGLKYVPSSKIIYLGLADGNAFTANSALSGGKIYFPGISNLYTGNGSNLIWHAGNDGSGSGLDADKVDGYHASSLWRSDGGVWNPNSNITLGASANSQEWSFDIARNGYTGCYWHVCDSQLATMLKVNADDGKVSAPYGFVGNLSGNASSASKLNTNNGTSVKPVYFSGGVPVECSYEIGCVKAAVSTSTTNKFLLGVTAAGYLWAYYHTAAYVNSNGVFWSSDRRLKDNIKSPVKNGMLNDETGLIRKFTWKDSGNASYGFIAQELMLHIPEAVDYDETLNKYSVNYDVAHSALIAQLVIKVKELEREISNLKQLIN